MSTYKQTRAEEFKQRDIDTALQPIPKDGYLIQQLDTPTEEEIAAGKEMPCQLYIVRAEMIQYYNRYKRKSAYQIHAIFHHYWRRFNDRAFRGQVKREQEILVELLDTTEKHLKKEQQYAQRCASNAGLTIDAPTHYRYDRKVVIHHGKQRHLLRILSRLERVLWLIDEIHAVDPGNFLANDCRNTAIDLIDTLMDRISATHKRLSIAAKPLKAKYNVKKTNGGLVRKIPNRKKKIDDKVDTRPVSVYSDEKPSIFQRFLTFFKSNRENK